MDRIAESCKFLPTLGSAITNQVQLLIAVWHSLSKPSSPQGFFQFAWMRYYHRRLLWWSIEQGRKGAQETKSWAMEAIGRFLHSWSWGVYPDPLEKLDSGSGMNLRSSRSHCLMHIFPKRSSPKYTIIWAFVFLGFRCHHSDPSHHHPRGERSRAEQGRSQQGCNLKESPALAWCIYLRLCKVKYSV